MSDIEQILYPTVLSSFREDIPPVQCIVWKGEDNYELLTFDKVYPFDTVDDIKRLICAHYENNSAFVPQFVFAGVPIGDTAYETDIQPSLSTSYIPLEWLWYSTDTNDAKATYIN